jgi:hypothetical protein
MGSDTSHFKFSWNIGTSLIRYGLRSIFNGCFPCVSTNTAERRQDCINQLEKDNERFNEKIYEEDSDAFDVSSSDIEEEIPIEEEGSTEDNKKVVYVMKESEHGSKKNLENISQTNTPSPTPPSSLVPSPMPSPLSRVNRGSKGSICIQEPVSPLSTRSSDSDWIDIKDNKDE